MRVISKRALVTFGTKYPEAADSMMTWHKTASKCEAESFPELKKTFGSADYVGGYTVFDVGGNKYRIVSVIHYDKQKIFVREVMTHKEYDSWTKKIRGK